MFQHWTKGARVGEWSVVEFATRDEAVSWARARVQKTTVTEVPAHSTMSCERVTVHADGREVSERFTTIG